MKDSKDEDLNKTGKMPSEEKVKNERSFRTSHLTSLNLLLIVLMIIVVVFFLLCIINPEAAMLAIELFKEFMATITPKLLTPTK